MNRKEFWFRFSLYILFGVLIPAVFLTWRFKLFEKVSKVSVGGWGMVAIIFVAVFFISLLKAIRKGMPFSFATQVIEGLCKLIIPLIIACSCVYFMQDLMKETFQFLCILTVSETIAVVVNPIPQWAHENKVEEQENRFRSVLNSLGIGGGRND
jgi:hypothetical protein